MLQIRVFYKKKGSQKLIVVIYVDDGLIAGTDINEINLFMKELQHKFKITVGSADCFLGMQIKRKNDGSISINQDAYTNKILKRFNMEESNPVSTPCKKRESTLEDKELKNTPYREAVGSLIYLAISTRPDIAFSVSVVSQALESAKQSDLQTVKRIFKYLRLSTKLLYRANYQPGMLEAFSDADYAGDIQTRRSTSGIVCKYSGGVISWMSKKQRSVTLSTTETEFL